MKDNILKAIDDILIVDVTPKITGRVQLSGYTDVWEGITDTRTVRKESLQAVRDAPLQS